MIISKVQKQPHLGSPLPAKTSPASKSAAPEIYATRNNMQPHPVPFEESRSTISGYDASHWLIGNHPVADDPTVPRSGDVKRT